jgi:hypothetical protein
MKTSHRCCSLQIPIDAEKNFVEAIDRRQFLWNWGGGLGGIALAHLLGRSGMLADTPDLKPRPELNGGLHHRAKAKRVVQLFMSGAASQVDTFDYKPLVIQKSGEKFDLGARLSSSKAIPVHHEKPVGVEAMALRQMGEQPGSASGFMRGRNGVSAFHGLEVQRPRTSTFMQNSGFVLPDSQHGSLDFYGLGSLTDNLPRSFVCPTCAAFAQTVGKLDSGFLPARIKAP